MEPAIRLQPITLGTKKPLSSRPKAGTPRSLRIHSGIMNAIRVMAETTGTSIRRAHAPVIIVARIAAVPRMLMKCSLLPNAGFEPNREAVSA